MGWKRTAYAVLATTTMFALSGWSESAFAAGTAVLGTKVQTGVGQVSPDAPAGQLQKAQILDILHSDVIPALSHYGLGDFLKTLTVVQASYIPDSGMNPGHPLWNVHMAAPEAHTNGQPFSSTAHFIASFDAKTGELLSFEVQNPDWTCTQGPSPEVAASQAQNFLQTFEPALYQKTQMNGNIYGGGETTFGPDGKQLSFYASMINFNELVNGIPFQSNVVTVNIDQFGHVVGMRKLFPLDSSKLPPSSEAMSLVQANQVYANALQMQKYYETGQQTRNADGSLTWTAKPMLVYVPQFSGTFDAVTGKTPAEYTPPGLMQNPLDLNVSGTGDNWNINKLDTVKQMIGNLMQTDLSKLTYHDQVDNIGMPNPNIGQIGWSDAGGPHGYQQQIIATVDKSNGQIVAMQHFEKVSAGTDSGQAAQPTFTLQQGEAKAEAILAAMLPSGQQELLLTREVDSSKLNTPPSWFDPSKNNDIVTAQNSYTFSFNLCYQGVPILDQSITIELDPLTGALKSFSRSLSHQVTFPNDVNTISPDQAKQVFMQTHPLSLFYSWPQYDMQYAPKGVLLYGIDSKSQNRPYMVDAFTGQPVSLTK